MIVCCRLRCLAHVSVSGLRQPRRGFPLGFRGLLGADETAFNVLEVAAPDNVAAIRERRLSVQELKSLTGVHTRDLRVLSDRGGEAFRALIQPRGHHALLLRMGMFRAVLTADRFLLFEASEPAAIFARLHLLPIAQSTLTKPQPQPQPQTQSPPEAAEPQLRTRDLTSRTWAVTQREAETEGTTEAFEVRCLRAVLAVTQRRLRRRANCFGPVVDRLLERVVSEEPEQALSQLLSAQRALCELERGCESIVHCIDDLLQDNTEMLSLLLTAKRKLPEGELPPSVHVEDVEALLESYHYSFKDVSDRLFLFLRAIESTQRAVQISLESKRTRLLNLNVHISIVTVSLASVATVSSIFGMNLQSGLETMPNLFAVATSSCLILAVAVYATYSTFLKSRERSLQKRLQRMAALRTISDQLPLLTDTILSQLEFTSQIGRASRLAFNYTGSHMLPELTQVQPDEGDGGDLQNYLTLDDFRELCQSEAISKDGFADAEIVKLFRTLDVDNNGRLEHHDVAEFLCTQSSPLSGLGPGIQ